jgi:hypothetical protein
MTLNILVASRNVAYLSGDFRLTYRNKKRLDELDTQKLIPVIRYDWGVLIAYSGIAKAPPFINDMGNWILTQTNSIPMKGTLDDLVECLLKANEWISKIGGDNRLIFSVVGFTARRPIMMVISNFIDLDGNISVPRSQLNVFQGRPKQPEIRIMGDNNAVLTEEKINLRKLLQENKDYQTIRNRIAQINENAAERSVTQSVSKECVTGYILPTGAAEIGPHGIDDKQTYIPGFVLSELLKQGVIGFKTKYDEKGNPLNIRWVGMTARFKDSKEKKSAVAIIHAFRNVGEPIHDGLQRRGTFSAWKVAGPNEPKSYTFTWSKSSSELDKSKKKAKHSEI